MPAKRHIPAALRPAPEPESLSVMWAVGFERGPNEFGGTHGPFLTEEEALEIIGEDGETICRMDPALGNFIAWRWIAGAWESVEGSGATREEPDPWAGWIAVHTDGSCYPNPGGPGGWAFVVRLDGSRAERNGHLPKPCTTNKAELAAVLYALRFLTPGRAEPIRIVSDSQYVVRALTTWGPLWRESGWISSTGKPLANRYEIETLLDLLETHRKTREVRVEWCRGHSGVEDNERADVLAGAARTGGLTTWRKNDNKFLTDQIAANPNGLSVVIAGGRDYHLTKADGDWLDALPIKISEVVSGGARGADNGGEWWAKARGIPVKRFPADWDGLGKRAGHIRNRQMAEYADAVVLFPGGTGTAHMRKMAEQCKRPLFVRFEDQPNQQDHEQHNPTHAPVPAVRRRRVVSPDAHK